MSGVWGVADEDGKKIVFQAFSAIEESDDSGIDVECQNKVNTHDTNVLTSVLNNKDIQLSKKLSWLLRHGAIKEGLTISSDGYISIKDILQHKSFKGKYNFADINRVVDNDNKKRYKLRFDKQKNNYEIKANQGHSIKEVNDTELIPILQATYKTVVHGTYLLNWNIIQKEGLSRMKRTHIHFAKGILTDPNITSGIRKDVQIYIYIDLEKALADGLRFFESANGVILTEGNEKGHLDAKYFLKVTNRSGFPSYTQSQDLVKLFKQYGAVNMDKINNKFAVMTFSNETEAADAIECSGKVNIYGEFLTVKKFTGKIEPGTPKKDFPKSKEKGGTIIQPKAISLTGDFYVQLDNVLKAVRLTQEEVTSLSRLYADLEGALQQAWPGCVAVPFGSITTGLGIKTSDADCFVRIPYNAHAPSSSPNHVYKAKRILQQYSDTFVEIFAIPRANTPIVKFFHVPTKTHCDLTFKTPLGSQNSKLIAFLLHADARLIPLAVLLKYWAKVHGFTGTGKLTNYALTMLIIFYLQQAPVSILPSVSYLQKNPADEVLVDSWNTGFMHQLDMLPKSSNTSSISELLGGFFQYYADFKFDELVVCPFIGVPVRKELFKDLSLLSPEFSRYKNNVEKRVVTPLKFTASMCIQDPFELSHNVASAVSSKLSGEIMAYFKFAAAAYDKEKLNNCAGLLKTILIQKPKLPKGKHNPEYRAVIYPHFLHAIIKPDWTSVIREVTLTAFEQMCHIKLTKMEEKPNPESRKLKEKFSGTVTKAIWKRKQFTKLYNMMDVTFIEKQKRITSEIMKVEKETFKMNIKVILTFSTEPKRAVISIKMTDGDGVMYREFGKFFTGTLHPWFITLMKPHLHSEKLENNGEITQETELDENVSNVSQSDCDTSPEDNDNDNSEGENNYSDK